MTLAELRREYTLGGLRRKDLDPNPIRQFEMWFAQARAAEIVEPNAMTLSTVDAAGQPSSRIVLLKSIDHSGFSFFTNYESRKGRELAGNSRAALTFFWAGLERQVNVRGAVAKLPRAEAEAYFAVRPIGSQLGAHVSRQSSVAPNREYLETRLAEVTQQFGERKIPMPDYWGGYLLAPHAVEFWQGRPNRLHDRFEYSLQTDLTWRVARLSP